MLFSFVHGLFPYTAAPKCWHERNYWWHERESIAAMKGEIDLRNTTGPRLLYHVRTLHGRVWFYKVIYLFEYKKGRGYWSSQANMNKRWVTKYKVVKRTHESCVTRFHYQGSITTILGRHQVMSLTWQIQMGCLELSNCKKTDGMMGISLNSCTAFRFQKW